MNAVSTTASAAPQRQHCNPASGTATVRGAAADGIRVHALGCVPYLQAWQWMREFTERRQPGQPDEIWWLEHPPVYTLGLSRSTEDLLQPDDHTIERVYSDRGGRATYHGPGQLLVYPLLDLRRLGLGPRAYVHCLEQAVITLLQTLGIAAKRRPGAPGVYSRAGKLAFVGVRIRKQCSYHGLALNVDPELAPFARIHPCGMPGLCISSLAAEGCRIDSTTAAARLIPILLGRLDAARRR